MKKDVKILHKEINGFVNPKIIITGLIKTKEKLNIYVTSDDEKIDYNFSKYGNRGRFILDAKPAKNSKVICIYCNDEMIAKFYNNIYSKLYYKMKNIVNKFSKIFEKISRVIKFLWKEHHFLVPPTLLKNYISMMFRKIKNIITKAYYKPFKVKDYNKWLKINEEKVNYKQLKYKPLVSILIPTYNINKEYLSDCLDSILAQKYENFEVCIADDHSTLKETIDTLKLYEKKDKRIKVVYRKENGHISKATNSALEIAKGEFIALMDNDDILTEDALYQMVLALNKNKNYDLIYSDEDKMDMQGNYCEPHFKADYSPDSLLGGNYICHFEILRTSIVRKIGGFRHEYVGAQDFDLFLRFVEQTIPERIYHIPKVLYHWRKVPGSTADTIENKDYAILNGKKAVEDALKRRKLDAEVIVPIKSTHYIVEYKYKKEPMVSIIIPTKDLSKMLDRCLESIYSKTDYKNYEIIVVNNNSKEDETFKLFKKYSKYKNFSVLDVPGEFNFSKINNLAVKKAKGEYVLFLNNDTEIISENWIKSMVGYAMQKHIGAVGVKLLYPDDTIQHAGVILGLGGSAGHAFTHVDADSFGFYGRLLVPYNYSAVTAACMMVQKKKFNSVGGFDEALKVAFNDVDFNIKLLDKGYYNVFLPQVELYHYESVSRGLDTTTKKYKQAMKEKDYLISKWKQYIENDKFYNPNFSLHKQFYLDKHKK